MLYLQKSLLHPLPVVALKQRLNISETNYLSSWPTALPPIHGRATLQPLRKNYLRARERYISIRLWTWTPRLGRVPPYLRTPLITVLVWEKLRSLFVLPIIGIRSLLFLNATAPAGIEPLLTRQPKSVLGPNLPLNAIVPKRPLISLTNALLETLSNTTVAFVTELPLRSLAMDAP